MAEVTYYFDGYDVGEGWESTPQNMANHSWGNAAFTDSDGDTELLNSNTCLGTNLGTISKVELRIAGKGDGNDRIDIIPIFVGGSGNEHQTTPSSIYQVWGEYVDITFDPNAPSPWTWAAVQSLECRVEYDKVASGDTMYCYSVEIRVTYTPAITEKFSSDTGSGVDVEALLAFLDSPDSGVGADALAGRDIVLFDVGAGVDAVVALVELGGFIPRRMAVDGYRCFMEQYVKNKVLGASPWKLPDGTLW